MTQAEPWVHGELPWLSGPLNRVHNDAWSAVDDFLRRWNYRRVELDGRVMTSQFQAHTELHAAFGFPEWCGHNWDAFNDCFGDYVEENNGARIAVVWRHIEVAARAAPATTAEVGWALLDCMFGHMPTLAPGPEWSVRMDIFVLGDGSDFDRPH
jgi:hypothetical protein